MEEKDWQMRRMHEIKEAIIYQDIQWEKYLYKMHKIIELIKELNIDIVY